MLPRQVFVASPRAPKIVKLRKIIWSFLLSGARASGWGVDSELNHKSDETAENWRNRKKNDGLGRIRTGDLRCVKVSDLAGFHRCLEVI
jgi:hypothetical protein